MTVSSRGIALIFGILALVLPSNVLAQENLDAGKTPAQLFHSDCVMCHKNTRGLSRGGGGIGGLEGFLREHYTASRESAAAIAGYIRQTDRGPLPRNRRHTVRPRHKSADKKATKPATAKMTDKKPSDKKAADKKTDQTAAGDKKSGEAKATGNNKDKNKDKKKDEAMPAHKKPRPSKSAASKPAKSKTMEAEAHTSKPAAVTGKPKDAKPAR